MANDPRNQGPDGHLAMPPDSPAPAQKTIDVHTPISAQPSSHNPPAGLQNSPPADSH